MMKNRPKLKPRVAIAGGGLAGLTCAKSLVDEGYEVRILEGLPHLGGRASTYRDADGDWIEQGLHIFLGTYSELKKLLKEVGSPPDDILFWMKELILADADGTTASFGINPLQAPWKTLIGALGNNDFLGPLDKLGAVSIGLSGLHSFKTLEKDFDHIDVARWWREKDGNPEVFERVIRPFCRAIQFTDAENFSAFNFLGWIHHSIRDLPHCLAGGYRGPREELFFQPIARYLEKMGAVIETGIKLKEIDYSPQNGSVDGLIMDSGERVEADAYVAAIPAWTFSDLLPASLSRMPFFQTIASLPVAPAISVQLWFDRKLIEPDVFHLLGHSLAPVYQDQSTNAYPYAAGSRISLTLSPADELLDHTDESLVALSLAELQKAHPEIVEASVVKSVVLKHKKHLIRPAPGVMSARPLQKTPVSNLFLAGDWTQQDYFGSQEGAVRSGRACAAGILEHFTLGT